MKLTKRHKQLLKNLADMGVEFVIFRDYTLTGGFMDISVSELREYLLNPKTYLINIGATEAGVSIEKYKQWWKAKGESNPMYPWARCRGIRTNGKRCKMGVKLPQPHDFNPDIDLYCRYHSRLG